MADPTKISSDLIWEITRNQNAYLVKRKMSGTAEYFSRDPLNLLNQHSRTQAGFVNEKAVGVQPGPGGEGVSLTTKKGKKHVNRPASNMDVVNMKKEKSNRKIYERIATKTAKNNYRPDLRGHAISRASAIKDSQRPKMEMPEKKLRGSKARKAASTKL